MLGYTKEEAEIHKEKQNKFQKFIVHCVILKSVSEFLTHSGIWAVNSYSTPSKRNSTLQQKTKTSQQIVQFQILEKTKYMSQYLSFINIPKGSSETISGILSEYFEVNKHEKIQ